MKKLILGLILVNLLSACAYFKPAKRTDKTKAAPVAEAPAEAPAETIATPENTTIGSASPAEVNAQDLTKPETATAANATATETTEAAVQTDPLNDPTSALAKRSVYFPFDVDSIQEADKSVIQTHGEYLGSHPERKVRTEGNADERGSSEYNLALGQRRANSTKRALVLSGAQNDQIEAISYGEEKPIATSHDESAWAQNRRADINYK